MFDIVYHQAHILWLPMGFQDLRRLRLSLPDFLSANIRDITYTHTSKKLIR